MMYELGKNKYNTAYIDKVNQIYYFESLNKNKWLCQIS